MNISVVYRYTSTYIWREIDKDDWIPANVATFVQYPMVAAQSDFDTLNKPQLVHLIL